jgi:hypothetical protein
LRVVDIFVKLVGAHSDHCSKEKKDVRLLQKKKLDAVYQTLGENEIQEQSKEDLMPEFLSSYYKMVANAGGQEVWENLPETQKNEKLAISMEELVKKLGQDAYKRLDDEEKQYLKLFIWVGCGCHKDLNTVRGGYAALTKFWSENNLDSPILLANKDNAAVLKNISSENDIETAVEQHAFEKSSRGAIKTTQIAGAIFNH